MKALVIIAHGSRRESANDEITALAKALSTRISDRYAMVFAGFLECAEPSIPAAIANAVQAGATTVTVFPYFLAKGKHVDRDIPAAIAQAQQQFPNSTIEVLPYLGSNDGMLALLSDLV